MRLVSLAMVKAAAGTPLKATWLTVVRPLPVRVTVVPGPAAAGATWDRAGATGLVTEKEPWVVADPPGVVTVMGPVAASQGNTAVISVSLTTGTGWRGPGRTPPRRRR